MEYYGKVHDISCKPSWPKYLIGTFELSNLNIYIKDNQNVDTILYYAVVDRRSLLFICCYIFFHTNKVNEEHNIKYLYIAGFAVRIIENLCLEFFSG